ncbi:type II toxin-antitoxin system VapC family toxin [Saccharomonospora viridis]|uniref:Ribonuclease VapC n=2 Tax=Saccharomonospora viridis TaxID=1852 RepID=C7MYE2_SACVD|nr:type II toxin-antitoxin system VapC family toxin [Saccharomonospora viridis]ACU97361.1 predicted nucleic acid-binding protein, contains PIN domain protein [Saccharomonospora viridis DSM 43017]KHF43813.1 plasmid stability protein StbB [Saccharomonospora viridis]SFP83466.1 hypothetical protein SAMN02982918_3538 [Saccharomonospora viridis]
MIVLDTNVVSELLRRAPDAGVVAWVDRLPVESVFITAVTAAELRYGVARLPDGRRKQVLDVKIGELLTEDFEDRVLPFDTGSAAHYATIVAARERAGSPISAADAQIAAICRYYRARLATRNVGDFVGTGVELINPWEAPAE